MDQKSYMYVHTISISEPFNFYFIPAASGVLMNSLFATAMKELVYIWCNGYYQYICSVLLKRLNGSDHSKPKVKCEKEYCSKYK